MLMDACDVDGHKAASLIYPSSLLPTAFCIGFHGNPLSRMISSHRSYRQIFFNLHNAVIYEASREAAGGKKGRSVEGCH